MQGNEKMKEYFSNLNPGEATQEEIEKFMRGLLENYVLEVSGVRFAFAEIETYTSADKNAYKRTARAGDIFFHRYGFDICFNSLEEAYGGVLVRSLLRLSDDIFIKGPQRCANAILNISVPHLSFRLLDAEENLQAAAKCSYRVRRADFDADGERVNEPRRLTLCKFDEWVGSGKKETKKYEKDIGKYEDENSTPNQAN